MKIRTAGTDSNASILPQFKSYKLELQFTASSNTRAKYETIFFWLSSFMLNHKYELRPIIFRM